jgi:hypothetical protein
VNILTFAGEPDVSICKFFFNVGNFLSGYNGVRTLVISNHTRRIVSYLVDAADAEASL